MLTHAPLGLEYELPATAARGAKAQPGKRPRRRARKVKRETRPSRAQQHLTTHTTTHTRAKMGIKGLTGLINDHAPGAIKQAEIKTLFGRKVAIDA